MSQRKNAITPKQIQIIKMAVKQLGLDDETYRDLLQEGFGVRSCTALTVEQANRLIDDLQKKGFHLEPKKKAWREARPAPRGPGRPAGMARTGKVIGLASAEEIAKIDAVAALIPWRAENGCELFLEKRLGIKGGRVRTAAEAYRAIEGLKKMFENGMRRDLGENWWSIRFEDEAVEEYVRRHAPVEFRDSAGNVWKR